MDRDWLKYWQKAENLENSENKDKDEEQVSKEVQQAQELYDSVLDDNS